MSTVLALPAWSGTTTRWCSTRAATGQTEHENAAEHSLFGFNTVGGHTPQNVGLGLFRAVR